MSVKLNSRKSCDHALYGSLAMAKTLMFFVLFFSYPISAMAYVGPGAGITMLGALWAVVLGFLIAVGGILLWPIRAFFRRRKKAKAEKLQSNKPDDQTSV